MTLKKINFMHTIWHEIKYSKMDQSIKLTYLYKWTHITNMLPGKYYSLYSQSIFPDPTQSQVAIGLFVT